MKDIYDLLNEIDVDIENMNIEEMETNDIEKIKVLNNVKSKIKSKKKNKRRKGIAIASVLAIGVITLNLFVSKNSILASIYLLYKAYLICLDMDKIFKKKLIK